MNKRKIYQIIRGVGVVLMLAGVVLPSCVSGDNYLKIEEKKLETNTDLDRSFHVVADEPQGFGLRMEGFIIGIEKSDRKTLGVKPLANDEHFNRSPIGFDMENTRKFVACLDDGKRTFVSHLVQAECDKDLHIPFIKNKFLYDAYCNCRADGRRPSDPAWIMENDSPYERSWEALEKLEGVIASQLAKAYEKGTPYTHVIVGTMGWNSPQEKAIRNLNSIFGNILINQGNEFKPLYIAITWPSSWNKCFQFFSLFNKADDADEIGFVWANALINKHLSNLRARSSDKKWPTFKIVAIGHSLGARLMTRAAFSGAVLKKPVALQEGPDLVIGLQGAFSMNRFLSDRKMGREGAPYADYKDLRGKVVLTWSENDDATPLANWISGANYAGAKAGYERASDEKYKKHFAFYNASEKGELIPGEDAESQEKKVIYIDATNLVKYNVLGTSGGAHSDIYNAYMGCLLGKIISKF